MGVLMYIYPSSMPMAVRTVVWLVVLVVVYHRDYPVDYQGAHATRPRTSGPRGAHIDCIPHHSCPMILPYLSAWSRETAAIGSVTDPCPPRGLTSWLGGGGGGVLGSSGRGRGRSQPARTPGGGRLECRRSLPARVGGERGWPTLYGKSARRPVTPYWGHPPGTGPGPGSACGLDGCPRVAGEYMWERGRSRAPNRGNFGGSLHTRSFPARQAAFL